MRAASGTVCWRCGAPTACVGQLSLPPGLSATRRTRTFERRVRLASTIRAGALSTPAEASEDASFIYPKFDFLTSKPVLDAVRALSAAVTAEVQLENKRTVP